MKTQILSAVFLLNHWRGPKIYTFFSGEKTWQTCPGHSHRDIRGSRQGTRGVFPAPAASCCRASGRQQLCARKEQVLWAGGPDAGRGPGADADKCPISSRFLEESHCHLKSSGGPQDPQIIFSGQDLSLGLSCQSSYPRLPFVVERSVSSNTSACPHAKPTPSHSVPRGSPPAGIQSPSHQPGDTSTEPH